jgi:DNA-binding transcriptional LysR family regulator
VQDRVVDGGLAGLPGLPDGDHPALTAIVLSRMPAFFTCAPGHPLLDRPSITVDDIAGHPSLAPPAGSHPLVEDALNRWSACMSVAVSCAGFPSTFLSHLARPW